MASPRTEMTDIRKWLMNNKPELGVQSKGKISKAAIEIYREEHDEVIDGEFTDEVAPDTGEVAPVPAKKRKWFEKAAPRADRVKTVHKRESLDTILSGAYSMAAYLFRNPVTLPVGRVMEMQAPAAGMVLDEAFKGSFADKMLQPLARSGKRGEALWAVVGPPVLVGAITAKPELYGVLKPLLVESMKSWVIVAGPKMKKAAEREAKLMEELGPEYGANIDEMVDFLFAPPVEEEA